MAFKGEQLGSLTQFPSSRNVTSWRQQEITISGNALKTVTFPETSPNMFFIQNYNDVALFVGITRTPTEKSHEFRVEQNNSMSFGRPVPTSNIFILNPSNKDVTITLFSVLDTFDINVLKNTFIDMGVISSIAYDGIIHGYGNGVSLPSGSNHIGGVDVLNKVALTDALTQTIEGMKDELEAVKEELKEANKKIVDILFYERESVSTPVTINFANETFIPNYISFIANDSDNPLVVTLGLNSGATRTVSLTAGDIFGDIKADVVSMTIQPKTAGSSISFRALFGQRG